MQKTRLSHIVLALLAVFSAVFLMATYGTALLSAPFASVRLNGPVAVDSDGEQTAIADTESRRVLILNAEGDLTGAVDCTTMDSPIDSVTDVCVSGGCVYVAGALYVPDSSVATKERVVMYDKGGNLLGMVYEADSSADPGEGATTTIKRLSDAMGGVVAAVETVDLRGDDVQELVAEETLDFLLLSPDEQARKVSAGKDDELGDLGIYDVGYLPADDRHVILSSRGIIDDTAADDSRLYPDRVFTSVDAGDEGTVYACDDVSGGLCVIFEDGTCEEVVTGDGYDRVHVNGAVVSICDREENLVKLCDRDGVVTREFVQVEPSIGFSIRMTLVWACALYLVALAVVLAVRKIHRRIASGHTEGFGPMLASAAVVVAVGVAVASLSFGSFQSMQANRASEIGMCADYLATDVLALGDLMEKCDDRDAIRANGEDLAEALVNIGSIIGQTSMLVGSAGDNGIGLYYTLYGKDDAGVFYLMDSDGEHVLGTSAPASDDALMTAFEGEPDRDSTLYTGRTLRDATQYRLVKIPTSDFSGVAGVIELGSRTRSFESDLTGGIARQVLTLLVMVLVVYLSYAEIRACARCLFSYRELRERRANDALAALTRPFTFCITILSSIDGVMTVLIARELLVAADMSAQSPLLGLPAVMLGFGLMIGQVLYGRLGSMVALRRLAALGAVAMLLCALFTTIVVGVLGLFWLYCIAKLAMSIPFGLLYTLGYSLPRIAESDEARALAAGGVKRTDTSAAALGTVLGGYAAQTLGNAWVYVLIAIACLPVLLMALNLMPKGSRRLEPPARDAQVRRAMTRFVKSVPALAIALLVVLPATVAAGYASFLFPLFSADLGLQKADINNICVLGQVVVYVCINHIDAAEAHNGKWLVTTVAVTLLGAVFLLFSLNTTLVWSIAVIALVGVFGKSSDGWKAMWLHMAGRADVPAGAATGAMFAVRSLALVVQPFILSALLWATNSVAVIVIGALCVMCAALFFLATRRTALPKMR